MLQIIDVRKGVLKRDLYTRLGRIEQIVGLTVEANGPSCNIGDICIISAEDSNREMTAEVVGFRGSKVLLMPYGDMSGIGYGSTVRNTGNQLQIRVGKDLIGRTVDAMANPIDNGPPIRAEAFYSIKGTPPNPLARPSIREPIEIGIKAIDGLLTMVKGRRMGIFAGSGVGKSTLLGSIARNVRSDINVIALVGERGREVVDFIENSLGKEGLQRSVLVVLRQISPQ
jgi:flagellum-specific ATP synthase